MSRKTRRYSNVMNRIDRIYRLQAVISRTIARSEVYVTSKQKGKLTITSSFQVFLAEATKVKNCLRSLPFLDRNICSSACNL